MRRSLFKHNGHIKALREIDSTEFDLPDESLDHTGKITKTF